ncbi:MAG TPA: VWA domain-containing protein, partial [Verrucomicrobiae bacterium]|nr:VWA domain-containing protein [Verrucomicrobiae bacterium]
MPYTAEISRLNPSCFVFLIDRSGSMVEPINGSENKRKCDSVADAINRLLHNLIIKCARGEGIRNFYEIAVIGYGEVVTPAFSGKLSGRDIVPISEIAANPARIEERTKEVDNGAGGTVTRKVKFPIWFEP